MIKNTKAAAGVTATSPFLTIEQAAAELALQPIDVLRLIALGRLSGTRVGEHWKVTPQALEKFVAFATNMPKTFPLDATKGTVPGRRESISLGQSEDADGARPVRPGLAREPVQGRDRQLSAVLSDVGPPAPGCARAGLYAARENGRCRADSVSVAGRGVRGRWAPEACAEPRQQEAGD
jgi:excisionase family DNA binding protein